MKNTGSRWGGAQTAGVFLKKFVKDVKWAHIDMSGLRLDKDGLASGFGVKLLNELIKGL